MCWVKTPGSSPSSRPNTVKCGPRTPPRCTPMRRQSATATKVTPYHLGPAGRRPGRCRPSRAPAISRRSGTAAGNAAEHDCNSDHQDARPDAGQPTTNPAAATDRQISCLAEIWFLLTGQTAVAHQPCDGAVNGYCPLRRVSSYNTEGLPYFSVGMGNFGVQIAKTLGGIGWAAAPAAAKAATEGPGRAGRHARRWRRRCGRRWRPVWATRASVGRLSVPAVMVRGGAGGQPSAAVPVSAISAAPGSRRVGKPARRHAAGRHGRSHGAGPAGPRYGFKPTVMARPPFAG